LGEVLEQLKDRRFLKDSALFPKCGDVTTYGAAILLKVCVLSLETPRGKHQPKKQDVFARDAPSGKNWSS
jgi:hypothetical protein